MHFNPLMAVGVHAGHGSQRCRPSDAWTLTNAAVLTLIDTALKLVENVPKMTTLTWKLIIEAIHLHM